MTWRGCVTRRGSVERSPHHEDYGIDVVIEAGSPIFCDGVHGRMKKIVRTMMARAL
jgi:hypothetical protein